MCSPAAAAAAAADCVRARFGILWVAAVAQLWSAAAAESFVAGWRSGETTIPQATQAALEAAAGIRMLAVHRSTSVAWTTDGQVLSLGDDNSFNWEFEGLEIPALSPGISFQGPFIKSGAWRYVAVRPDGQVLTWDGDDDISSDDVEALQAAPGLSMLQISVAVTTDGKVLDLIRNRNHVMPPHTQAALEAAPDISMLECNGDFSHACAAVTSDGQVLAWGDPDRGGEIPKETQAALDAAQGISMLKTGSRTMVVVTTGGQVLMWGGVALIWGLLGFGEMIGGNSSPKQVALDAAPGISMLELSTPGTVAIAAVTTDGQVLAWGNPDDGGEIPQETQVVLDAAPGISILQESYHGFVALTTDGQMLAWGHTYFGPDLGHGGEIPQATQAALSAAPGISMLKANIPAMVAVTTDGQVLALCDSIPEVTQAALEAAPGISMLECEPDSLACVAVTTDGQVLGWGGGEIPQATQVALETAPGISMLEATAYGFTVVTSLPPCRPGFRVANGYNRTGESWICVACAAGKFANAINSARCSDCLAGSYTAYRGSAQCVACIAGRFNAVPGSTGCIACRAGKYSQGTGSNDEANCVACAPGKVSPVGSNHSKQCTSTLCPDKLRPCSALHTARANSTSGCPAGTDVDTSDPLFEKRYTRFLSCVPCPDIQRCPDDGGGCSDGARGNLCGSCQNHYYSLGPTCAKCPKSMLVPALLFAAVGAIVCGISWRLSAGGSSGMEMNCVISFNGARFELVKALQESMMQRFEWPKSSVYFDNLDTTRLFRPDARSTPALNEDGSYKGWDYTHTDEWHVFFREAVADAPAMVFVMNEFWCESTNCKLEVVWFLVLKTLGPEALLRATVGWAGDSTNAENYEGVQDLYGQDVVQTVLDMKPEDRQALWDGSFFLVTDEYSASSEMRELLRDLGCPDSVFYFAVDDSSGISEQPTAANVPPEFLEAVGQFASDRNQPELQRRRRDFAKGYATAARSTTPRANIDEHGAMKIDLSVLQRLLVANAAQLATKVHALVLSIAWPHVTFSLLPLLLPYIHWPVEVIDMVAWVRGLAFLDFGMIAHTDCFADDAYTPADKKLFRLLASHVAFWSVVATFFVIAASHRWLQRHQQPAPAASVAQSPVARAVSASVWTFLLGQAGLFRSCLSTLHCVGSSGKTFENFGSLTAPNTDPGYNIRVSEYFRGVLQTNPDVGCDQRVSWLAVFLPPTVVLSMLWLWQLTSICKIWCTTRQTELAELATGISPDKFLVVFVIVLSMAGYLMTITVSIGTDLVSNPIPDFTRSGIEYQLPAFGALGVIIYGLLIPVFLYHTLAAANKQNLLNLPECRGRYGILFLRFKPGKWRSEFRILGRKTCLLLTTTVLAEQTFWCLGAQFAILAYSLYKQWQGRPYAEVGTAVAAFQVKYPHGDGWSRGDKLEALSLGSQLCNVILVTLALIVSDDSDDDWYVACSVSTLACVLAPIGYALSIMRTEWKSKPSNVDSKNKTSSIVNGGADVGPGATERSGSFLGDSLSMPLSETVANPASGST